MKTARLLSIIAVLLAGLAGCQKKESETPVPPAPAPAAAPGQPDDIPLPPAASDWDPARWVDRPAPSRPPIGIPRLAEPFVIDGELNEWASALAAPSRSDALAVYSQAGHEWLGPDDASQESFIAWNADGVCLATIVRDSEIFNDRPPELPWDHDCATVTVNALPPGYDPDADLPEGQAPPPKMGLLVVPPRGQTPADVYVFPAELTDSITVATTAIEGGYAIEVLVPWSVLDYENVGPGTRLGTRFNMIDYDLRDGEQVVPFALAWHRSWYQSPHRRPPGAVAEAVLVDELVRSAETDLESVVFLNVDNCPPAADASVPIAVDLGVNVGRDVSAVELLIEDWRAERAVEQTLGVTSSDGAWPRRGIRYTWSLAGAPYGQYTVTARMLNAAGDCLGEVYRDVLIVRGFEEAALAAIDEADIPAIATEQPFATTPWLLAAANLERFRQRAVQQDIPLARIQARELCARLTLLQTGQVTSTDDDLLDLLALATDPEAQAVVEFYPEHVGHVNLYWGALPIATVTVQLFADEAAATLAFQDDPSQSPPDGGLLRMTERADGRTNTAFRVRRRIISAVSPSAELSRRAVTAVAAGEPISLADTDVMRGLLAAEIEELPVEPLLLVPDDMKLYVGDVHMHTIFSDGSYSPLYMAIQSFCNGMDFSVITDHNDIVGAQVAQAHCAHYGFRHSVIVGDEVTTAWAHLNGYPLRELVDWELPPYELVRSVHAQGAAIHWNHPSQGSEWGKVGFAYGIGPLGVDAWEHVPPAHDQWRAEGVLPTLVGSTDEHRGYFFNVERSVILTPTQGGVDVADAVRRGNVCLFDPTLPNVAYGAPHMIARVREALMEGTVLRQRRAAYVSEVLVNLDIVSLIRSSGQKKINAEQAQELLQALKNQPRAESD